MATLFLSPRAAAKETGVTESHIRVLIREGRCPGYRAGSYFRVDCSALLAAVRAGQDGGAAVGQEVAV